MKRWPWLRTALTVACLTPAAAQGQGTAAPTRSQIGVLTLYTATFVETPGGPIPETAPRYMIREEIYRRVLGDALGDQLDYYSETLDRYQFPDPSVRIRLRRLSCAQICRPDDQTADREWPGRGPSCGAVTGAAPVSTADRVRQPRCAASSEIDRPCVSVCHERVARFSAAGASRHPSRVRRVRRIRDMGRRKVSLAGARAAARRGVHLLARILAAGADPQAGGAAGALDCLSGLVQYRG